MGLDPVGNDPMKKCVHTTYVEFKGDNAAKNAYMVNHYMQQHGMLFVQACDFLEMRLGYHFDIVEAGY